ncbi:putative serine dehydratase domain [Phytophthora infestans]|uniref:Putative serine dehydratase domain n=1 Tax=Phytophthora infestans TaxID=4787 RepID=A0A833W7C2_PHYIN|nr:putative serine dehydratase domain [Phytophthora infestans]KAF4129721.1 putative serine dehydratase domain [Phytophthora infestans]
MWRSSALPLTAAAAATAIGALSIRRLSALSASRVSRRVHGHAGDSISSLETPCLLVDLDALEINLKRLPESLKASPKIAIRPHAKAHKSSALGQLQLQLSHAVGLCCQKVGEAEAMFHGGVRDILLSNEVYGLERYERMAVLAKGGATISLIFDNFETVQQAAQVAEAQGVHFRALVEVNVGQDRCGVDTVEEAVELAKQIESYAPRLQMVGIQAYHGAAQHIRSYDEKKTVIAGVAEKAKSVRDALVTEGVKCDVVTGGGTGTYLLEASSGVFTEVQPGSYLFNDADYARNLGEDGEVVKDWEQSLYVLTTVMSKNANAAVPRVVVDAGTKAVSLDSGSPVVHTMVNGEKVPTPLEYHGGGDEHGILKPAQNVAAAKRVELPALGSKVLLVPGHCDPTTNMYDYLVGYRGDLVEHVWEIEARGPGN